MTRLAVPFQAPSQQARDAYHSAHCTQQACGCPSGGAMPLVIAPQGEVISRTIDRALASARSGGHVLLVHNEREVVVSRLDTPLSVSRRWDAWRHPEPQVVAGTPTRESRPGTCHLVGCPGKGTRDHHVLGTTIGAPTEEVWQATSQPEWPAETGVGRPDCDQSMPHRRFSRQDGDRLDVVFCSRNCPGKASTGGQIGDDLDLLLVAERQVRVHALDADPTERDHWQAITAERRAKFLGPSSAPPAAEEPDAAPHRDRPFQGKPVPAWALTRVVNLLQAAEPSMSADHQHEVGILLPVLREALGDGHGPWDKEQQRYEDGCKSGAASHG